MRIVNPVGKKGENAAVEFLEKKKYKILERNYRKQYAEIDIIALQQVQGKPSESVLVFVEVKTRTSDKFGSPFEAITSWKLRPVIKLAEYYRMIHSELPNIMRIDAIGVLLNAVNEVEKIEQLENISEF